jgi:hypothetical protein
MAESRIRFWGLDTRQLNDDADDGLLEYANNVRPYGTLEKPYWVPFKNFQGESIDNTIPEIPGFACETTAEAGGHGVTEFQLPLSPGGGIFAFDCQPYSARDKFEIIHNSIRVATSAMTFPNEGPFDNTDLQGANQFIGLERGAVPSRNVEFNSETGFAATITGDMRQYVWWIYDAGDFSDSPVATLRVVGIDSGTEWTVTRVCE